jgi:predicted permease
MRWPWREINKPKAEEDLAEELRAHLAIETHQRVAAGEAPEEAMRGARRAFGNFTKIEEETREAWGWRRMALLHFLEDARFGLRMMRKTPVWTAVIGATLALGIGLSTAIFSVVYGVLFQPLPYPNPGQIVALWPSAPKYGYARFSVNAALWLHWQEQSKSFEDIALSRPIVNFNLTSDGPPERLQAATTSANLLRVLGVAPLLGRGFTDREAQANARVAILSYGLWRRRFGGDSSILGRKVLLNGEVFEVIGVMPREFRYPSAEFELWAPLYIPPEEIRDGGNYQYVAVGRLKYGITVKQAQSEISALMLRLAQDFSKAYMTGNDHLQALVEPLALSDAVQMRKVLYVLLAAVGCLLLIGCLNLGLLLIARASARSREMVMRAALGAGGGRLARQMLAEILPLGVAGAIGGVLLAWCFLKVLIPFLPATTPRVDTIGLNGPVLAFACATSFAVVLMAGLFPARIYSRGNFAEALQQSSRTVTGRGGVRDSLIIAQVALTLIVLFGGALFARSLQALLRVSPGFSTQSVLTMHMTVTRAKYKTDQEASSYQERLLDRIRTIPGVIAAGMVNRLPLSGIAQTGAVQFEGISATYDTDWRSATPGYFEAIGIPLKRGRLFRESDRADSPRVGLIDEQLARKVFGNADPVGRRFRLYAGTVFQGPWVEIVGVVGHILNDTPEKDYRPQAYWPATQREQDRGAIVVRTAGHAEGFAPAVVEQIRQEDQEQPVYDIRAMDQWLARTLQSRDLLTALVALFGGASLLMACLGLYGVIAYAAGLRSREFGIRMALGAESSSIFGLVFRHAGKLVLWASAIGLALSWPVGHAIESMLFGVSSGDAISWSVAPALLGIIALVAGLGPARRAAVTNPAVTLRAD